VQLQPAIIRRAVEGIGAPIATHQVEYHPFLSQAPMLAYLRSKAIPLTAYAPLAQGRAANDPTLATMGRKHGATAAQVAIAWLLDQESVIAIPRSGETFPVDTRSARTATAAGNLKPASAISVQACHEAPVAARGTSGQSRSRATTVVFEAQILGVGELPNRAVIDLQPALTKIGQLSVERDFLAKEARSMSAPARWATIEPPGEGVSVRRPLLTMRWPHAQIPDGRA
jgi:hypothetical protein